MLIGSGASRGRRDSRAVRLLSEARGVAHPLLAGYARRLTFFSRSNPSRKSSLMYVW